MSDAVPESGVCLEMPVWSLSDTDSHSSPEQSVFETRDRLPSLSTETGLTVLVVFLHPTTLHPHLKIVPGRPRVSFFQNILNRSSKGYVNGLSDRSTSERKDTSFNKVYLESSTHPHPPPFVYIYPTEMTRTVYPYPHKLPPESILGRTIFHVTVHVPVHGLGFFPFPEGSLESTTHS